MNDEEYYKMRDWDLQSDTGTKEIKALFKEIDDERTGMDLGKIKVLELGSGCGRTMLRLRDEFGIKNIIGIDNSQYAVNFCKKRGLNVSLGDAENLKEFKDNSFDFVYAQYILEFTDGVKVLKEALHVAKKVIIVFSLNAISQEKISDLLRKIPEENHRFVKDIVRYTRDGIDYRNWILVLYRKKKIGGET